MKKTTIAIRPTTNPAIVKFEANTFLTKQQSFEFHNIDEAKDSPLAQQLFYLPFVKTIYISGNFIAVERYDIVDWKDVQDQVAEQIEAYLNNNGEVVTAKESPKKVPVSVYAESTPNPSVMRFVANKKLVVAPYEFKNIDDAKHAPLAIQLFHFPFVKEVFMDENYVSIAKFDMAEWNDITMELREFIRSYIEEGKEIVEDLAMAEVNAVKKGQAISAEDLDDTSKEIVSILEEHVKPAVASDGGNIVFQSFDEESKTVKVILQGACSGCPSSTFTLKNGIETMLREMLQGKVMHVEAING